MTRSAKSTLIVFGLLGGLLLLDLLLPIVNLLFHADWSGWMAALLEPGAGKALANFRANLRHRRGDNDSSSAFRSDTYSLEATFHSSGFGLVSFFCRWSFRVWREVFCYC